MTIEQVTASLFRKYELRSMKDKSSPDYIKSDLLSKLAYVKRERADKKTQTKVQAEPFETSSIPAWNNYRDLNSDSYSNAVMEYAEIWAKLMQIELRTGAKLTKELADLLSDQADVLGISGFQFGCAKNCLYAYWKYGEELGAAYNAPSDKIKQIRSDVAKRQKESK